jgi:hypothetical protein
VVESETLSGGGVRLRGLSGTFLIERVRPGVLAGLVMGRDTGEFGNAPFEIIERECRFFQRPVEFFLDGTRFENATGAVAAQWTHWLKTHRETLRRMHVLTSTDRVQLRMNVAAYFSQSEDRLMVLNEREEWTKALAAYAGDAVGIPDLQRRLEEPRVLVSREESRDAVLLRAPRSAWMFRKQDHVLLSRFTGDDSGDLTDMALGQMESFLDATPRPLRWFIDVRAAENIAPPVSQAWTEWLSGRPDRFTRITALSPAPLFPLVLTVAKYRSGTERLFRIHRELEPFIRDLSAATSAEVAAAWT